MKNQEIKFKDKSNSYSIIIGEDTIRILPKKIKKLCPKSRNIALIIDKNIPKKFRNKLKDLLKNYNLLIFFLMPMKKINLLLP